MGLIRLRDDDVALARSRADEDIALSGPWAGQAQRLCARYLDEAKSLNLRVVEKSSTWLRLSKVSTTYYKEIRLGSDWKEKDIHDQAVILAHELRHARQWRRYGPSTFRNRYIFYTRWRWGVEVQCYAESIRALVALGAVPTAVDKYIDDRVKALWEHYVLGTLHKGDVMTHTRRVLEATYVRAMS
jgi:hypothetical protein